MSSSNKARTGYRKSVVSGIAGIVCAALFMLALGGCEQTIDPPIGTDNTVPVITITTQPQATTTVTEGSITGILNVGVSVTEAATLSYQWYFNTSPHNQGGTKIDSAIAPSFTIPAALTAGTYYYYCEVRAPGAVTVRSVAATVTVNPKGTPPVPVITISAHPAETTTVTEGSITGSLSVTAGVTENATLSYQWYSNTSASNQSGTTVSGATTAGFTIPAALTAGTYYYYCELSAPGAETVRSTAATVVVNAHDPSIKLEFDTWADGEIVTGVEEYLFRFTATADRQVIHVDFGTLDHLYVQLFDRSGNPVSDLTLLDGGAMNFISQTVSSGELYYIKVTPYFTPATYDSDSGTYKLLFNTSLGVPGTPPIDLTEDIWGDGEIPTRVEEQWARFTATADTQHIFTTYDISSTAWDIYAMHLYDSNGNRVESIAEENWRGHFYSSYPVINGDTYYIRLISSWYSGMYNIGFTSSPVPPEMSPIKLISNRWTDELNIPKGEEQWLRFTATADTQFIHVKINDGPVVYLQLYDSSGNMVRDISTIIHVGYPIDSFSQPVTSGNVYYIRAGSHSDYDSVYQIVYNESEIPPPN